MGSPGRREHGEDGGRQAHLLRLRAWLREPQPGRAAREGHATHQGRDRVPHLWCRGRKQRNTTELGRE